MHNLYSQFKLHDSPVTALTASPSGRFVLAGFGDGKTKQYSLQNNGSWSLDLVASSSLVSKKVTNVELNPLNLDEYVLSAGNAIILYDHNKNEHLRKFIDERPWLINNSCRFLTQSVVTAIDNDNSLKFYDLRSRLSKPLQTFRDASDSISCFDFKSQRSWLICCGTMDGSIYTYDLRNEKLVVDEAVGGSVTSVSFSESLDKLYSEWLLVGFLNEPVRLMDANMLKIILEEAMVAPLKSIYTFPKKIENRDFQIESRLINKDHTIISGSETGEVYLWNVDGKGVDVVLKTYNSYMTNESSSAKLLQKVTYLSKSQAVLAGGADGKLHLWDGVKI